MTAVFRALLNTWILLCLVIHVVSLAFAITVAGCAVICHSRLNKLQYGLSERQANVSI